MPYFSSSFLKHILGADVEVVVEETQLFAHKAILKHRCPFFYQKHLSSYRVVLEDETFRAFYAFLEFLYTGNVLSFHSSAPQVLSPLSPPSLLPFFFFFIDSFIIFISIEKKMQQREKGGLGGDRERKWTFYFL